MSETQLAFAIGIPIALWLLLGVYVIEYKILPVLFKDEDERE